MKFLNLSRLGDDDCAQDARERQNSSMNNYNTYNSFRNDCNSEEFNKKKEFAAENPNLRMKMGYGYADKCNVDNDSRLRNDAMLTQTKCKNQLFSRQNQAVPNLSRGVLHPNTESRLIHGEDTGQKRPCNVLSEVSIDRFTPLVSCLKGQVQNAEHIIPEWTWGGSHSRYEVRDKDYLEKCGYNHNGKAWEKKRGNQEMPGNNAQKNAEKLNKNQRENYGM